MSTPSRPMPELPANSRYEMLFKLASGGMASVYVGRLRGAGGFWRLVAIKKAHEHLLEDPAFRRMLVEEARLASKIHHPNVVSVLDVEQFEDHLLLVMDYVEGASLSDILAARQNEPMPPKIAVRIALDACAGLAAAHDLTDNSGKPLNIIHRDVSPHNLLVGIDGTARLADFGIAKSDHQRSTTTTGSLKGKLAYMAPEYVNGKPPDQRCDVFGLGIVIWEALANRRLFRGENEIETLKRITSAEAPLLSTVAPWLGTDLDPVLSAALAKNPDERFASAKALGNALEIAARRADLVGSTTDVGAYVRDLFEPQLAERRRLVQERVATDVGPASTRTGPAAPRALHSVAGERTPSLLGASAQTALPPESTLDGSGVTRTQNDVAPASSSAPIRRSRWIVGGVVAMALGGAAAVGFARLSGSTGASGESGVTPANDPPMAAATTIPPPSGTIQVTVAPSAVPTSTSTVSSASIATSGASVGAVSPPSPTTTPRQVHKPVAPSPAPVSTDALPPNPYKN